ncbi:DUF4190 domain-containing protein [Luteolibacter sp. LG18]|uniref:DUF4190 domain-containing protein n=1 Tax=Luteolibacter sp. LG18 TaxID=2819286 RepID=UPI002B2DCC3F|nr:hypothetical protein llg_08100 [Luteolibacter sp. LG18]
MEIQQQPKTSGLAIASLVTSLLGLGLVGVVCGHIALSRIKKSAGALTGHGIALAGLIIGYISVTVVVVLMVLSFLFVGARAWKKGSDRAACIMHQRNVQQAVRSYQAANHLKTGARIDWSKVTLPVGSAITKPCPAGGEYFVTETIPPVGMMAVECPHGGVPDKHEPTDHHDW